MTSAMTEPARDDLDDAIDNAMKVVARLRGEEIMYEPATRKEVVVPWTPGCDHRVRTVDEIMEQVREEDAAIKSRDDKYNRYILAGVLFIFGIIVGSLI